jgi:uncharacterized damage-inducible protein DinB
MLAGLDYFKYLLDYGYWARDRIFAALEPVPAEVYLRPVGLDHGSIHATLLHVLASDLLWWNRWHGLPADDLGLNNVRTLDHLKLRWKEEEANYRDLLNRLTEDDLKDNVAYLTSSRVPSTETLWQVFTQMSNHGTQHRSEVALALTAMGASPGYLDFMGYVRERGSA